MWTTAPKFPKRSSKPKFRLNDPRVILVASLAALLIASAVSYFLMVLPKVTVVDIGEKERIRDILLGGTPAVVQCINETIAVHPFALAMSAYLKSVSVYAMDCSRVMDSGETLLSRFKLSKLEAQWNNDIPLLLLFANGLPPVHLSMTSSTTPKTMATSVVSRSNPRVYDVVDSDTLGRYCLSSKRGCVVLRTAEKDMSWLGSTMMRHRTTRFLRANPVTHRLVLHDESAESASIVGIKPSQDDGTAFYHVTHTGALDQIVRQFVDEFVGADTSLPSFTASSKKPQLIALATPPPPPPPPSGTSQKPSTPKGGAGTKPKPATGAGKGTGIPGAGAVEMDEDEERRARMERETLEAANWVWEVDPEERELSSDQEEEIVL